ncbi:unnamed protein product [Rhizoctonia solani]|nr:unnamed protein product [Rhizoctonia solani]
MSFPGALLDLILEAYHKVEIAKNLALVSVTFFTYDSLITIEPEIRHVWSSKWGYGRMAFHFNRIWSIIVLGVYVPMIFSYNVPIPGTLHAYTHARCRRVITFYGYSLILLIFNTSIVMSLRAWILFDRNPFVFASGSHHRLPHDITKTSDLGAISHWSHAGYGHIPGYSIQDLGIESYGDPAANNSMPHARVSSLQLIGTAGILSIPHSGLFYYVINCASLLVSICLGLDENRNNIALGSAYMIAIHSMLCNRILLSLRVFNDELKSSVVVNDISMTRTGSTTIQAMEWRVAGDGSYQSTGVEAGADTVDCERQDPPMELKELRHS